MAGAAAVLFAGSVGFLYAGIYEISPGRRPPGLLGAELILRGGHTSSWSASKWRRNGLQVLVMAIGLGVLGLWVMVKFVVGSELAGSLRLETSSGDQQRSCLHGPHSSKHAYGTPGHTKLGSISIEQNKLSNRCILR